MEPESVMSAADIAAWIGAAAWVPQIVGWVHRRFVPSVVTILPSAEAEIGFTTWGPIFNVRMALSADRKDAIIDGFELLLRHKDGEMRTLRWSGLSETLSEISDGAGRTQVLKRDESPIAMKIGTESLVEKLVRFQEPRYHETDRPRVASLAAHFNFLKQSGDPEFVAKTLASKELHLVNEGRKAAFWWKPGGYSVTARLSSPSRLSQKALRASFELSAIDVDNLNRNVAVMEADLRNTINSNLPDNQPEPIAWNWVYVSLRTK